MPNFKVTFMFNQEARGFSETYYKIASNEEIFAACAALGAARATILASDVRFEAFRYSDLAIQGDSYISRATSTYSTSGLPGDLTAAGYMVRFTAGQNVRRSVILRGLPDDWIFRHPVAGSLQLTPQGFAAVRTYAQFVQDNGWALQARQKVAVATEKAQITAMAPLVGSFGTTILTLPAGQPPNELLWTSGKRVVVSGATGNARAINGTHRITSNLASTDGLYIRFTYGCVERYQGADIANAMVRLETFTLEDIDFFTMMDVRSRKSGRAFFVPAGRSPGRC